MTSLSFPDVNVWISVQAPGHVHHETAKRWWRQEAGFICFTRFTQLGFLRITTTAAAMDGKALNLAEAWAAYDFFFQDDRVTFLPEASGVEAVFRRATSSPLVSPKVWADAWLLAVAEAAGGAVVTFDRALAARGAHCLLGGR